MSESGDATSGGYVVRWPRYLRVPHAPLLHTQNAEFAFEQAVTSSLRLHSWSGRNSRHQRQVVCLRQQDHMLPLDS